VFSPNIKNHTKIFISKLGTSFLIVGKGNEKNKMEIKHENKKEKDGGKACTKQITNE
jgi:hypothetical protein